MTEIMVNALKLTDMSICVDLVQSGHHHHHRNVMYSRHDMAEKLLIWD